MAGSEQDQTAFKNIQQYGVSEKFYKNYSSVVFDAESYNIHGFKQIGMLDPFPKEQMKNHYTIPETGEHLVYQRSRYYENNSPNLLYHPSKKLLFKIMRACIVANEDELWYN